jgi:hypothetical protein
MVAYDIEPQLERLAKQFPAIVLTGSRQGGKSTLCRRRLPACLSRRREPLTKRTPGGKVLHLLTIIVNTMPSIG